MECLLDGTTAFHEHPLHEYAYCVQGNGFLDSGGVRTLLCPGHSIFVPAGQPHRFLISPGGQASLRILCWDTLSSAVYLSPPQIALLGEFRTMSGCVARYSGEQEKVVEHLLAFILSDMASDTLGSQSLRWSAMGLLLTMHGEARQIPTTRIWRRYREKILSVREWLDVHIEQVVCLDALAQRFGLSRSILTREFKKHVGYSIIDYCNLRRVERAAQILATNTCPVTQAAYEAGFANISHFHRQFKAVLGVTPAGFRKQIARGRLDNVV